MNYFIISDLQYYLSLFVFMAKNLKFNFNLFPGPIVVIMPGDRFIAFIMVFVQTFLSIEYKKGH